MNKYKTLYYSYLYNLSIFICILINNNYIICLYFNKPVVAIKDVGHI